MSVALKRVKRRKIANDKSSPERYYLKPVPGMTKTVDIQTIASQIEVMGSLTSEDVYHVITAFVRKLKENLVQGMKVKVDGLGTFQVTFNCEGTVEEKDCTVKNIYKVNIRFMVDNTLRLANDSTATTRSAPNNVSFYIKSEKKADGSTEEGEESEEGGEEGAPN